MKLPKMTINTTIIVLLILLTVLVAANITVTLGGPTRQTPSDALPCRAVPKSFVAEHPECANALLRSMNVSNIHIQRYEQWGPQRLVAGTAARSDKDSRGMQPHEPQAPSPGTSGEP